MGDPAMDVKAFNAAKVLFEEQLQKLVSISDSSKDDSWKKASAPVLAKCAHIFLQLKGSSRKICLDIDGCRQKVLSAKGGVDQAQLRLQNLTYERNHIARAIQLCQDFSTKQLDKIEEDDGEPLLKDIHLPMSEEQHSKNLEILTSEIATRQRLEEDLASVQMKAKAIESKLQTRQTFLDALPEMLSAVEKAAAPLAKYMSPRDAQTRSTLAASEKLPVPMHTLLIQLMAYAEFFADHRVCEKDELAVAVVAAADHGGGGGGGDMAPPAASAAAAAAGTSKRSASASVARDDEGSSKRSKHGRSSRSSSVARDSSKMEDGRGSESMSRSRAKRSSRTKTSVASLEGDEKAINLQAKVFIKETSEVKEINITFHFVPDLNGITVVTKDQPDLLANLIPDDTGVGCPTATMQQLLLGGARLPGFGKMYKWAQRLAGLVHPPNEADTSSSLEVSTRGIVERIMQRIRSWTVLSHQLDKLAGKPHPIEVHPSCENLFVDSSTKSSAKLQGWQELPNTDMDAFPPTDFAPASLKETGGLKRPGWQRYGSRFFSASFSKQRGEKKVHMSVLCELGPEYPVRAPRFLLQTRAAPAPGAAPRAHDNMLKAIENELNAHHDELVSEDEDSLDWVLSHQLRKLQACFDILGEATTSSAVDDESFDTTAFSRVVATKAIRGRDRRKALVFNNQMGNWQWR